MRACSKTARAAVCCCPRPWYHLPRHSLRPPSPAFRHQVTHKGFQADLAEITGAAVTTRGIYVATKGGAWRGPCCVGRVAWPVLRRPPAQPLATARSRGLAAGSGFQLRALLSTCAKHRPSPPPTGKPPDGERKLYLHIEGPTQEVVRHAKSYIKKVRPEHSA